MKKIPQFNFVAIFKFLKQLKHEKFNLNFIFRATDDPVIKLPGDGAGSPGNRGHNRISDK